MEGTQTARPQDKPLRLGPVNHVELVYRPGERQLARKFFELLDLTVVDLEGELVDIYFMADEMIYASEVRPEQWEFEKRLKFGDKPLMEVLDQTEYIKALHATPQHFSHWGIHVPSYDQWDAMVERVKEASVSDPYLKGRVHVLGRFGPHDPGAFADTLAQAFIHTDIVASGLLTFGQLIDYQHFFPPKH